MSAFEFDLWESEQPAHGGEDDAGDFDVEAETEGDAKAKKLPSRQSYILVIDVHSAVHLFRGKEDEINWGNLCRVITNFAKRRIIVNEADKFGLVFFGTQKSKNSYKMDHIWELIALDYMTAESIKLMMDLSEVNYETFLSDYGSLSQTQKPCPMSRLFQYALRTFRFESPITRFTRKLLIFSHRENPCENLPEDSPIATQLGLDLINNNTCIELFPLVIRDNATFDCSIFYDPLLVKSEKLDIGELVEENPEYLPDDTKLVTTTKALTMLRDLERELKRKAVQHRVVQKTIIQIGPNPRLICGVSVMLVITEAREPAPVLLRAEDNVPIVADTKWIDSDSGQILGPDEIRTYYPLDHLRVRISNDEILSIKGNLSRPIYEAFPEFQLNEDARLIIMGFKSIHVFDRYRLTHKSQVYLLYPLESLVTGSGVMFNALVQAMTAQQRLAVFSWQYFGKSPPTLFAGWPQTEYDTEGNVASTAIYLIALPYAEDLREIPVEPQAPEGEIDALEEEVGEQLGDLLDELDVDKLGFPSEFPNPKIEQYYAALETLALGNTEMPAVEDPMQPSEDLYSPFFDRMSTLSIQMALNRGTKRAVQRESRGATGQIADITEIRNLHERSKLGTLKLPQLKDALKTLGLPVSGAKTKLIERLEAYFKSE